MRLIDADALMRKAVETFYTTNYFNHISKMIEDAPTIDTAPHWIPVTERLPESNFMKEYLVSQRGREWLALASYDDGWFDSEGTVVHERVTAYMPLPQPYKGE